MKLYLKNLLLDLYKHKFLILTVVILTALIGALIGYKTKVEQKELTAYEQAEIDNYLTRVSEYEESVRLAEEGLKNQSEAVANLQKYVDNSILMKIDSSSVKTATAQYAIKYGSEVDKDQVNQIIISYLDSSVRENIENADELQVEYWDDVFAYSIENGILSLSFSHYDAEKAKQSMNLIRQRLEAEALAIARTYGSFSLTLLSSSQYNRADNEFLSTQTSTMTNLRNNTQWQADAENYLISVSNNRDNYRNNNVPEAMARQNLTGAEARELIVKYAILGALFGAVGMIAFFLIRFIVDDRLRNAESLEGTVYNVLGIMKSGKFKPELDRILMDVAALKENAGKKGVFVFDSAADQLSEAATIQLTEGMKKSGLTAESGKHVFESAEELKRMLAMGSCLLLIEAGKTKYRQMEEYRKLCERYQVAIIGVIVIE